MTRELNLSLMDFSNSARMQEFVLSLKAFETAAEETGDMNYQHVKGSSKIAMHKVRLDQENRLTGYEGERVKDPTTGKEYRTFHVHQVGGHTK